MNITSDKVYEKSVVCMNRHAYSKTKRGFNETKVYREVIAISFDLLLFHGNMDCKRCTIKLHATINI